MMIKKILTGISCFVATQAMFAQQVVDTLYTSHGTVLMYANRTWKYLEDIKFNGVMNEHVHCQVVEHEDLQFVFPWDTENTFSSMRQNDISRFKDTIWMCLVEDLNKGFHMPVEGIVTSRYGWRKGRNHNGIDLNLNTGDPVKAAWGGKIRYAKWNNGGFGNLVIIRHDNGLETLYGHLSKINVTENQRVEAGEVIGLGGNTGRSFGAHLHFEVRFYDIPMNPEQVIDFENKQLRDENLMVHRGLFRPGAAPMLDQNGGPNPQAGSAVAGAAQTAITRSNTNTSSATNKYYKVRSGDTLSAIAAKNKTTIAKICQLNGIKQTTVLQVGRNLRVR